MRLVQHKPCLKAFTGIFDRMFCKISRRTRICNRIYFIVLPWRQIQNEMANFQKLNCRLSRLKMESGKNS